MKITSIVSSASRTRALSTNRRRWLTISLLGASFAALAALVAANTSWIISADTAVTAGLADTHNGALNRVMHAVTLLGDRIVIGGALALLVLWALRFGRCRTPIAVLVGAFLANPVLEAALKGLVGRERPDLAQLVSGDGPAFPSGHVLATVGFYGILAVIAWRSSTRRSLAVGALVASAVVIALVGFSRIYLGVHWMTDVIGGLLVGTAFVAAAAYFLRDHQLGPTSACPTSSCARSAHSARGTGHPQPVRVPSRRAR
jgi:membrane-associated phospholipid phosphatase